MNISKEHLIYAGVGLFVLLVFYSSTKEVELKEVGESDLQEQKEFDSKNLPSNLKPPYKLATGEQIPRPIKRNFNIFSIGKPRFDNDF
jgi:hypothetical protein